MPASQLSSLKNVSYYWAHLLSKILYGVPDMGLPPVSGVIFSGPLGNGKHTTAEALAGTLKNRSQNPWYCLRTCGYTLDPEDVADACAVLEQVDDVLQQGTRVCLLLDCPEHSRHSLAIQEYLYQLFLARPGKLFPILITEHLSNIIPELQRKLLSCPCPKPDQSTRQRWILSQLNGKIPINFSDDVNHISLARDTKDFSWKQMADLRMLMLRTIAFKYLSSPKTYNPNAIPGLEKQLLREGKVTLNRDDVQDILFLIRSQNTPATQGMVQYVAAGAAPAPAVSSGSLSASTEIPEYEEKRMDPDEVQKAIARHKNPAEMPVGTLLDVDDL